MDIILQASHSTLIKSKNLLSKLSDEQLCNCQVSPYHSSLGTHIRHILDFYTCIFNGLENNFVDLTNRDRDVMVENNCCYAAEYLDNILNKLETIQIDATAILKVNDDLGNGNVIIDYTIGALFAQANSHTIHHYAIINYILDRLDIEIEDESFGFNPTSPQRILTKS